MAGWGMRFLTSMLVSAAFAASAAAEEKEKVALDDPSRQHLNFFGAIIYADEINPLTGDAKGRVYIDGTALNKTSPKFPTEVTAESLKVDLENGKIVIAGWPKMVWPGAILKAKDADTTITLEKTKYEVKGAASYEIKLDKINF